MIVYFLMRLRRSWFLRENFGDFKVISFGQEQSRSPKKRKIFGTLRAAAWFLLSLSKCFRQASCGHSMERLLGNILWYRLFSRWYESWSASTACHLVRGCIVAHAPHGSSSQALPNGTPQRSKFLGVRWNSCLAPWRVWNLPFFVKQESQAVPFISDMWGKWETMQIAPLVKMKVIQYARTLYPSGSVLSKSAVLHRPWSVILAPQEGHRKLWFPDTFYGLITKSEAFETAVW